MIYRNTFIFKQDMSIETFDKIGDFKKIFEMTFLGLNLLEAGYKFKSSEIICINNILVKIELEYVIGVMPKELGLDYYFLMRKHKDPQIVLDKMQRKYGMSRIALDKFLKEFNIQEKYVQMLTKIIKTKHEAIAGK